MKTAQTPAPTVDRAALKQQLRTGLRAGFDVQMISAPRLAALRINLRRPGSETCGNYNLG
jgi:hypothetical protein